MIGLKRAWFGRIADIVLIAAIVVASSQLALSYIIDAQIRTLIDWELSPAVMDACGHGFVQPTGANEARADFLLRRRASIGCNEFAWGGAPTGALPIALANRYSIYGAALAMRVGGVSWTTLDWYLSGLFAASMVLVYGMFRTAVAHPLALAGVIAVAFSTVPEVSFLRDFVKLPIFAALWLALASVLRRGLQQGPRAALVPMVISGALLGLGAGMRMDSLVFAPVFVAVTVMVLPGWSAPALRDKAIGVAAFAIAFLIVGGPILRTMGGGSNSAHVILLGEMRPFDRRLGIASAPYDVGGHYSDGYVYTMVLAHDLMRGATTMPALGSAAYDAAGMRLLRTLVAYTPADIGARMIGATWQVFRYMFDWRVHILTARVAIVRDSPLLSRVVEWRNRALSLAEGRERVMAAAVLLLVSMINWRLGVASLLMVLYFCGYSMLQFSRRHAFHLDVAPVFMLLLAVQLPLLLAWQYVRSYREGRQRPLLREHARALATGAIALVAATTAIAAVMFVTRAYQQRQMTALVDATLRGPWIDVPSADTPLAPLILVDGSPIQVWVDVYQADPEAWRSATLLAIDAEDARHIDAKAPTALQPLYFMVELNGSCGATELMIAPAYSSVPRTFDLDYSRVFRVPVSGDRPSHLLVAAFVHTRKPRNRFEGFAVPAAQRGCVTAIRRAVDPSRLPLPVLSLALRPDWREQPLYQRLLATPEITIVDTFVGPPPVN